MFTFDDLKEQGFTSEEILDGIEAQMGIDDIVFHLYHFMNDRDVDIPSEVENHYELHCK